MKVTREYETCGELRAIGILHENFDDIKAFGELLALMDSREEIDYWLRRALDSGKSRLAQILNDRLSGSR
jgi:hypothetical protein